MSLFKLTFSKGILGKTFLTGLDRKLGVLTCTHSSNYQENADMKAYVRILLLILFSPLLFVGAPLYGSLWLYV